MNQKTGPCWPTPRPPSFVPTQNTFQPPPMQQPYFYVAVMPYYPQQYKMMAPYSQLQFQNQAIPIPPNPTSLPGLPPPKKIIGICDSGSKETINEQIQQSQDSLNSSAHIEEPVKQTSLELGRATDTAKVVAKKDRGRQSKDMEIEALHKTIAAKDALLVNKDQQLKKALKDVQMLRRENHSLLDTQENQLAMLMKFHSKSGPLKVVLKKKSDNEWESDYFDFETSDGKQTTWQLKLWVMATDVVVWLLNDNCYDKSICASANFELLGQKAEMDRVFFSGDAGNYNEVVLMYRYDFRQQTWGLDRINAHIQIDIHVMK